MQQYLNDISELADDGVHSKTIAASRIILGGMDTQPFWGFSFTAFTKRFSARLQNFLPDPSKAQLNLAPGFNALRDYADSRVDRISDPVRLVTHDAAEDLAGRVTVIGLAGERGSGRGTLAGHLVDTYHFTRMEFNDPLRVAASVLYNMPLHYFSDQTLLQTRIPQLDMTPEQALHALGSDVCQGLRRSIWNDRLLLRMAAVATLEPTAPPPNVVVSGLRFDDEAEYVRSLTNGRVAWLSRTDTFSSATNGAVRADDVLLPRSGGVREFLFVASKKLGLVVPELAEAGSQASTPVAPLPAPARTMRFT